MPASSRTLARRPTRTLPRFLPDSEGGAVGDDEGDAPAFPFPNIAFFQQAGPLVVPAGPLKVQTPKGPQFYLHLDMSGVMSTKFLSIPNDPNLFSCNQATPPAPSGDSHTTFSGSIDYNPITHALVGSLLVQVQAAGTLPGPGGNAPALPGIAAGTALSEAQALALVSALGGFLVNDVFTSGPLSVPGGVGWINTYTGGSDLFGAFAGLRGYYVLGFMNTVPCGSAVLAQYLNAYILAQAPTIFGAPASVQHLLTYDDPSRTYTGSASGLTISYVPPGTEASYFLDWLVTPDDGSTPYHMLVSQHVTGLIPGSLNQVTAGFPPIVGAVVTLADWQLLFNPEAHEDWSSYSSGLYFALPPSGGWTQPPQFGLGGTWDDFENAPVGGINALNGLRSGYWRFPATFSSLNGSFAYDDFESYTPGAVSVLNGGTGWPLTGTTGNPSFYQAYDDFEADAVGPIATLPVGFTTNRWPALGTFLNSDLRTAWDDFEAYGVGPIVNLPIPANPANHWSQVGTFG